MPPESAEPFSRALRAYLIAAAGCGKTETLAWAAGVHSEGRQLVLTHTHAGVKAVKARLNRIGVDKGRVHVDTIAGFALRYAASFPFSSGLTSVEPATSAEWEAVYEASLRIVGARVGREVLAESYSGMFVDEYQDCVLPQHELVMAMADVLPCRIALDPLQGIFGFGGATIDHEEHLAPTFERFPDLATPFRWSETNPELGEWLTEVRTRVEAEQPIDLVGAPIGRGPIAPESQLRACYALANEDGSAVAVGNWPNDCHSIALRLGGSFTVMEPIECPDLMSWATTIENAAGPLRALSVIEFASACMTQVGTQLRTAAAAFREGRVPVVQARTRNKQAVVALIAVASRDELETVLEAMTEIVAIPEARVHRRELWAEMTRAIRAHAMEDHASLRDAAWRVRDRGRYGGRQVEYRTVSRTVLVKGLEFEHALVLNADRHDGKNLYVAMTRGSRSLTVLSSHSTINQRATARA